MIEAVPEGVDYQAHLEAIYRLRATLPEGTHLALAVLSGSHSYGSARPDSDVDMRGIFVTPIDELLRIWDGPPSAVTDSKLDVLMWELGHFARLAGAANPNALELLWAPPVALGAAGALLRANRWRFLSRRVFDTHIGYAEGQLRRARDGTGGSRGVKHLQREKFLFHTLRVVRQALRLLEEPDQFSLRLDEEEAERLWWWARRPLDEVEDYFVRWRDGPVKLALDDSELPERVDTAALDRLVLDLRHAVAE